MNQVNKINKAMKIIKELLPKTYEIPEVKIYKTVYSMLKREARDYGKTYKNLIKHYNSYLNNTKISNEGYIDTKYYKPRYKAKHNHICFEITALGGNPILINLQNTAKDSLDNYLFVLLHEIGHRYYKPKGKEQNERLCDLFAIRWYKKHLHISSEGMYDIVLGNIK